MKLEDWLPLYDRICAEFRFSKRDDLASAKILAGILGSKGVAALHDIRRGFPAQVMLCGGSEGLADELSSIVYEGFVVAADGATTTLIESGFKVDMIVTDLDGIVEDQVEGNAAGVPVFLHAHGDNKPAVTRYAPMFAGPLVGTCQCKPPQELVNFGGFTDGDRAACICAELGATEILLAGFDFENPANKVGRDSETKRKKLVWAKRVMELLQASGVRLVPASELSN